MDISNVIEALEVLGGYSAEELEKYSYIARLNMQVICDGLPESEANDVTIVHLAAAKTNYEIALIESCDGVKSFSAGDISISRDGSVARAKELYELALADARELVHDSGFAFMGV